MQMDLTTQYGFCQCGCGAKTRLAPYSNHQLGWIKGLPTRYVNGHNGRLSPIEYLPEDRGHDTPCWIWQRHTKVATGHGQMVVGRGANRKSVTAYRVYYERKYGPVPAGLQLHHECEVPACVNPDHLAVLTVAEHRQAHGKLTPEVVAEIRALWARGGMRQCDIGDRFRVSQALVSKIVRNEMWVVR